MPADDRRSRESILVQSEPYLGFTYNPVPFEVLLYAQRKAKNTPCNFDSITRLYGLWPCKLLLNFHLMLKLVGE